MTPATAEAPAAGDSERTAPVFRTRLTELLGIDHPVLCGGLMWLADARYVAACVRAGAMGFITARTFPDPGAFRAELQKCRALAAGHRFGVNLYATPRAEDNALLPGHARILIEEGIRIVETAGLPPKDLLPVLREAGVIVIHKTASVRHAVSAERLGVDAVAVVGAECGGHPGLSLVGTFVQAPLAGRTLRIPLSIGGGIGHGSQIAAAIAMGADAVTIGTRMTVAEEIWAHRTYKERLIACDETASRLVMATFRNTYRVLDNAHARRVAALEAEGVTDYEAYREMSAGVRQREAYETGDIERGLLSMGQSVAFADRIEPVAAILARLMHEARAAAGRLAGSAAENP